MKYHVPDECIGWAFHGHQNVSDTPMAWLDIPLVAETDQGFFEFGPDQVRTRATPERSNAERLWGSPGLIPVALAGRRPASPLVAYRWAHTDAALAAQLELEAEGIAGVPDLFTFSDALVFEKLNLLRTEVS